MTPLYSHVVRRSLEIKDPCDSLEMVFMYGFSDPCGHQIDHDSVNFENRALRRTLIGCRLTDARVSHRIAGVPNILL